MAEKAVLALFTRQLAVGIGSGLPLDRSLTMAGKAGGRELRDAVSTIVSDLDRGSNLSSALGRHPRTFDHLYVEIIAAAEATGQFDTMLVALADMLQKQHFTARRVKGLLAYPGFVFLAASLLAIALAPGVAEKLGVAVGIVVATLFVIRRTRRRSPVPQQDLVPLWMPIFGAVYQKSVLARVMGTLGCTVSAGIPIADGLGIAARVSGSRTIHGAMMRARGLILEGRTLEAAFTSAGTFPPMVVSMLASGEQAGRIDALLMKIAEYYEDEANTAMDTAISILQPTAIVLVGILVAIVVLNAF